MKKMTLEHVKNTKNVIVVAYGQRMKTLDPAAVCAWTNLIEDPPLFLYLVLTAFNMAASLTHTWTDGQVTPLSLWSLSSCCIDPRPAPTCWYECAADRWAHCRYKLPASCWEGIDTKNVYWHLICLLQSAIQRLDHLFKCTHFVEELRADVRLWGKPGEIRSIVWKHSESGDQ